MKLQSTALSVFIVVTVFYLLHIGQALIQPIVIAGVVAYLISILAHAISAMPLQGIRVPKWLSMVIALSIIFTIISLLVQLITENIKNVVDVAPAYQQNLETRILDIYALFGVATEEAPNLRGSSIRLI